MSHGRSWQAKVIREPLVHFLLLGAAIFALNAVLNPAQEDTRREIRIARTDVERLQALYTQQWGDAPTARDLPYLVDDHIRQEVLFREGKALGFEDGDLVVRNRVVQKMLFLLNDPSAVAPPNADEVAGYFKQHADKYLVPEQVGFAQIYFNPTSRGAQALQDAQSTLAALAANPDASGLRGDTFYQAADPSPRDHESIRADFGAAFADAVFAAPVGTWQGPVASAHGVHLIRVLTHTAAHQPALADVTGAVMQDMIAERVQALNDQAYARIKRKYKIVIDSGALPAGSEGLP